MRSLDGSVEIFAETEEKILNELLKVIDIKGGPEDLLRRMPNLGSRCFLS